MARLVTTGFELNDLVNGAVVSHPDPCTASGATATISTANPRTGTYHARCAYAGDGLVSYVNVFVTTVTAVTYSLRAYMYLSALPSAGTTIQPFSLQSGVSAITGSIVTIGEDGSIDIGIPTTLTGSSSRVQAGAWFRLETQWKIDTANVANDTYEVRVDGVTTAAGVVTGSLSTTLPDRARVGVRNAIGTPAAINADVDDIAINDSTGGSQTSWNGDGKVVLLKPISDNAGGTGWTLGTGTALGGNGFTAVSGTPPVGVADLAVGSDPKQIRNASSNANVNYDANLTTYTNGGVGVRDTVNVLVPLVATAAPVTTSAKQGTIGIASNPAITNIALGAGGTSGAFWSGSAGGAYASGWKWSFGTTTYAPSVTLGTSPVARITQVTASTRIAVVCALGMYVDFTPAATSFTPVLTMAPRIPTRRS